MNEMSASTNRETRLAEPLRQMPTEEFLDLYRRLVKYAETKMTYRTWRGVKAKPAPDADRCLSHGKGPEDIVGDVIQDVLDGKRRWNVDAQPDLLEFLKGCVSSQISHLVVSKENRSFEPRDLEVSLPGGDPAREAEAREELERVQRELNKLQWEDQLAPEIVSCVTSGMTSAADIAEHLKVDVVRVYRVNKRLKRELKQIRKDP